jgi:4-amino-4-deoxy-L-arabinose transferase-like glycosyltransferase
MLAYARRSAGGAREAVFFAGSVRADPGARFYAVALAFRTSPLVLLGLLCAMAMWRSADAATRRAAAGLVAFAATYAVFMTLGDKKFERYVLPAVPPLDVVAGLGLYLAAQRLAAPRLRRRGVAVVAIGALLLAQTAHVATRRPYYLSYYSPLLGGGRAAARWLPVGWGEGMDLAARYLNALPGSATRTVATPSVTLLAPLAEARTVPAKDWRTADSIVLYVDDVQIGQPEMVNEVRRSLSPDRVVRMFGIDYAWVYDRPGGP